MIEIQLSKNGKTILKTKHTNQWFAFQEIMCVILNETEAYIPQKTQQLIVSGWVCVTNVGGSDVNTFSHANVEWSLIMRNILD